MAVYRSFLLTGPAVDASCVALGAWLRLQSYVSSDGIESPVIVGARDWPGRKWLVTTQLERSEIDEIVAAGLAAWREADLEVFGFDADGLATVEARRRGGREGGRGRKKASPGSSVDSSPISSPNSSTTRPGEGQPQLIDSSSKPLSGSASPFPSGPTREAPPARDARVGAIPAVVQERVSGEVPI
jgi:hypothetical protein